MGSWFSSSKTNNKAEENDNVISNNVTIANSNPLSIHNTEIVILLYVIAAVKIMEFIYFMYRKHMENQRKKYATKGNTNSA